MWKDRLYIETEPCLHNWYGTMYRSWMHELLVEHTYRKPISLPGLNETTVSDDRNYKNIIMFRMVVYYKIISP